MQSNTPGYGVNRAPVPLDTGYAAAIEQWDRRTGLAARNAKLWRTTAVTALAACVILAGGLAYAASRRQVELYVVRVDPEQARSLGVELAGGRYEPDEAARAYFVAKLVRDARGRVLDPVAQNRRWREVYAFLAGPAETRMSEYAAKDAGLTADGRRVAREVEVGTVLQEGKDTYQVRWTETTYAGGAVQERADWTGLFTVTHRPPTDKRAILTNPIGLYVTDINWGRDFTAAKPTPAAPDTPDTPQRRAAR